MFSLRLCVLIVAVQVQGFQWLDTLQNNSTLVTCVGDVIRLTWGYTMTQEESAQQIQWFYSSEGRAGELIALVVGGHFVALPAFSGRVKWTGGAGIEISQVGVLESGNYSLEVAVEDTSHVITRYSHLVTVQVAEPPQTDDGVLHVQQTSQAVYDVNQKEWMVQLTCGNFTSLGQPAVQVVWKTADGQAMSSAGGPDNGYFTLMLPIPPSPTNISCSLPSPPLSPATSCLPPLSPLLNRATVTLDQGAKVTLDEVKAALSLMEAGQNKLEANLKVQREEFENRTRNLETQLEAAKTESRLHREEFENKTRDLEVKLQAQEVKAKQLEAVVQSACNASDHKPAKPRVSFHASRMSTAHIGMGTLARYSAVINEGDAFDPLSGYFLAPLNGTYFFTASTSTDSDGKVLDYGLVYNAHSLSRGYAQQPRDGYDVAASISGVVHMTTGQHVSLYSYDSDGYYGSAFTSFSGFLIAAD